MSDTQLHDNAITDTTSPGELLLRQREALGVPLVDAARALNLRPAVVEGLEQDNYAEIPVAAYRRGYLRAYAKYLGMDDSLVLEAYQTRNGSLDTERKVTPVSVSRPPSKIGAWLFKLVTLLVIVGLIAVTVMWWESRGGSEPPSMGSSPSIEEEQALSTTAEQEPAPVSAPAASEPAVETPSQPLDEPAAAAPTPEPAPEVADDAAQAAEQVAAESIVPESEASEEEPAVEEALAAAPNTLELTFNEQSWTEIFDANNQRVFVGLQTPGTTATVEGEPPFRLTIGNATGVELRFRGDVIDLPQRAGANNVARFTLGE